VLDRLARIPKTIVIDVDEADRSARHLLRTLFVLCAYCETTDGQVTAEDASIAEAYPRGFLAPQIVSYEGAPGMRSRATHADYAALGLGILCIAVMHGGSDDSMLRWLLYAETLRLKARMLDAHNIQDHIEGVEAFARATAAPDVDAHPELTALCADLCRQIAKRVPANWRTAAAAVAVAVK
jgi:hypothetical protein